MGKKLIVKGADFSINAIENVIKWYNEYHSVVGTETADNDGKLEVFLPYSELENWNIKDNPINCVKLYVPIDCEIEVNKVRTNVDLSDNTSTGVVNQENIIVNTINVNAGENTVQLPNPITLTSADMNTKNITIRLAITPRRALTYNTGSGEGWRYFAYTGYTNWASVPIQFGCN